MSNLVQGRILNVPRGTPGRSALELDMTLIDQADSRLHEVRTVSQTTKDELKGLFNEAANVTSKYMAWIEYEILKADKNHTLNRSVVILEKVPEEAKRLKESGIKMNEDLREALIAIDETCQVSLDILNALKATKALLEASYWTFIRAHNSADSVSMTKSIAPTPNFVGEIGRTYSSPQSNYMGKDER